MQIIKVEEMNAEGKTAIQQIQSVKIDPEIYQLKENEERSALEINEKKKLEPLIKTLIAWINSELTDDRIIVKDIQEDIYDGQILQMLIEKLTAFKLSTQTKINLGEISRKQNLKHVIEFINTTLDINNPIMNKWKVESIYEKDLISIIHLLVALVKFFKVPLHLPDNLTVNVIVILVRYLMLCHNSVSLLSKMMLFLLCFKKKKQLEKKTVVEKITGGVSEPKKKDRDAFDALFDHAPDKLDLVKNVN